MRRATLYLPLKNQSVRCTACNWYCRLKPGTVGVCGTRYNQAGQLYSLVYGQAASLHLDPVEKKPLYHFFPGANLLSFGTLGCNFACRFCQNYTISQINKTPVIKPSPATLNQLIKDHSKPFSPQDIVSLALDQHALGIAYTYNEPTIFAEYAHDTMVLAHRHDLKNVFVSNGYMSPEARAYFGHLIDAINIDLKSSQNAFYQTVCRAQLPPVLENIRWFYQAGVELEVTTLIIPGHNDSSADLKPIATFLVNLSADIPWHLSAYFPCYQMSAPPTPLKALLQAYQIGKHAGLRYIYLGNVDDPDHSTTFCPQCHTPLISRHHYQLQNHYLNSNTGTCRQCRAHIYGIYS